ncbi:Hsp70 family protein [Nocardia colli]|nr:Hsp70 family protein [Nocardia colli]
MNSMTASVAGVSARPVVRTRRTALTFDHGGPRIPGIPQFSSAVTDFADLTRAQEPVIVGGRIWAQADLVAAVARGLRQVEAAGDDAGVLAYPAVYSGKQVERLRQSLALSGDRDVRLVPEPIAALAWLESEYGPLQPGCLLIYDLGATCLDVTVARIGRDRDDVPTILHTVRSHDFGGRVLGAMIARYADLIRPKAAGTAALSAMVDIDGLRTAHVRDSLGVVRRCVRSAGVALSDVTRILLIGGASRPPEVADVLAELGLPLVISTDPGHSVAAGAALLAAGGPAPIGSSARRPAPALAVFSSAAVVSAITVAAVVVLGESADAGRSATNDRAASIEVPPDTRTALDPDDLTFRVVDPVSPPAPATMPKHSAYGLFITPVSDRLEQRPSIAESGAEFQHDRYVREASGAHHRRPYADPAYFVNPLPFDQPAALPVPGQSTVAAAAPAQLPDEPTARPRADQAGPTPHSTSRHSDDIAEIAGAAQDSPGTAATRTEPTQPGTISRSGPPAADAGATTRDQHPAPSPSDGSPAVRSAESERKTESQTSAGASDHSSHPAADHAGSSGGARGR